MNLNFLLKHASLSDDDTNFSLLSLFQTTVSFSTECSKVMWHLFGAKASHLNLSLFLLI